LDKKSRKLADLSSSLYENKQEFSSLITKETGKIPIQANNEIDNCIKHLDFMRDNTERFMMIEEYRLNSS